MFRFKIVPTDLLPRGTLAIMMSVDKNNQLLGAVSLVDHEIKAAEDVRVAIEHRNAIA